MDSGMDSNEVTREEALAASRALPESERRRLARDVLTRAKQLRDEVREDLSLQRWGADDLQMERYNRLASTVNLLYVDNPAVYGLIELPDAILQSYGTFFPIERMPPDMPARRIEGRLTVLIEKLEMALGDAAETPAAAPARVNVQDERRYEWDAFICHASEDKPFVSQLATELQEEFRVWYDDFTLKVGDRLRRKIDEGLAKSRYGIVVLSKNFFNKHWPQEELDGLAQREVNGHKVILPVWLDVGYEEVRAYSVTLADRVAARANLGVPEVVRQISEVLREGKPDGSEPKQCIPSSCFPTISILPTPRSRGFTSPGPTESPAMVA